MAYPSTIESDFAHTACLQIAALYATRGTFLLPIFLEDNIVGRQEVCHGVWCDMERRALFQPYTDASIHKIVLLSIRDNKSGTGLALLG